MTRPKCDTPLVLCRVKPEATDLLELSHAKLSIGPIPVKPIAKGFTKCKYLIWIFIFLNFFLCHPVVITGKIEEIEGQGIKKNENVFETLIPHSMEPTLRYITECHSA